MCCQMLHFSCLISDTLVNQLILHSKIFWHPFCLFSRVAETTTG